jgi:hypothetical protein
MTRAIFFFFFRPPSEKRVCTKEWERQVLKSTWLLACLPAFLVWLFSYHAVILKMHGQAEPLGLVAEHETEAIHDDGWATSERFPLLLSSFSFGRFVVCSAVFSLSRFETVVIFQLCLFLAPFPYFLFLLPCLPTASNIAKHRVKTLSSTL